MPMHSQIHSRVCGCSCFLSVSVFCHRAHTGIFYVIGYWLFTPFVVLKLLISCTWLNARYPFFPPLEYVHAPTRTDTRSRSHTPTHTLVNKGLRNRGSSWVPPGQPFDCCCFVLQLTSEVFFMKWTARWLQNCGHRHCRRWLLGYAAGSTKALSAAAIPLAYTSARQGSFGQLGVARLRAVAGAWNCTRNWVMTHVSLRRRSGVLIACKWCGGLVSEAAATATRASHLLHGANKWRLNHSCEEGFD